MNKIKIGIVTSTFPPKGGGIATAHYNIYQILKDTYDVKVFAYNDIESKSENGVVKRKTPTWMLPFIHWFAQLYLRRYNHKGNFENVMRIFSYSVGAWLLNKPIKEFSPDILIVPDNHVPLYWLKKRNFKIAWFTRNNYLRFRDNPLIVNYFWLDIDISSSMERKALDKADVVLSPSKYMIKEYHRAFTKPLNIHVINNFIVEGNLKSVLIKEKDLFNFGKPLVFMPSAGTINKGSRYVFEIIRRIAKTSGNKVEFFISGPIVQELVFELKHLDPKIKIYMPGQISWENNLKVIQNCYLVVSPTLIENFSNAFVEAFILGKPIVTFDVGGNNEIVDNEINGFIVPYIDVDGLVEKSCELIDDTAKYQRFSIEAKKKGLSFSEPKKIIDEYNHVFRELMTNKDN